MRFHASLADLGRATTTLARRGSERVEKIHDRTILSTLVSSDVQFDGNPCEEMVVRNQGKFIREWCVEGGISAGHSEESGILKGPGIRNRSISPTPDHAGDYVEPKDISAKDASGSWYEKMSSVKFPSSSSDFDHSSSSHHIDDNVDENEEETSRSNTPSPSRLVHSLSNLVPLVLKN
ncbi:hypothetical protein Tco_1437344 [Tanacetum coccineum]